MIGHLKLALVVAIAPLAAAAAMTWLAGRLLPQKIDERYAAALGIAAAIALGYVLVPDWPDLAPSRHWHWLPYLGLATALIGPATQASGVHPLERWLLWVLAAIVAAWLIVPMWSTLTPAREISIAILTAYLALLAIGLDSLPQNVATPRLLLSLAMTLVGLSLALAASVSLKYGLIAGLVAAALGGAWLATLLQTEKFARIARGAILSFAFVAGGVAYVGAIDHDSPRYTFLLVPLAPLMLWCFASGPLSRVQNFRRAAAEIGLVLAMAAIVIAWLLLTPAAP